MSVIDSNGLDVVIIVWGYLHTVPDSFHCRFPMSYETGGNIFFIKGDLIANVNTCERL